MVKWLDVIGEKELNALASSHSLQLTPSTRTFLESYAHLVNRVAGKRRKLIAQAVAQQTDVDTVNLAIAEEISYLQHQHPQAHITAYRHTETYLPVVYVRLAAVPDLLIRVFRSYANTRRGLSFGFRAYSSYRGPLTGALARAANYLRARCTSNSWNISVSELVALWCSQVFDIPMDERYASIPSHPPAIKKTRRRRRGKPSSELADVHSPPADPHDQPDTDAVIRESPPPLSGTQHDDPEQIYAEQVRAIRRKRKSSIEPRDDYQLDFKRMRREEQLDHLSQPQAHPQPSPQSPSQPEQTFPVASPSKHPEEADIIQLEQLEGPDPSDKKSISPFPWGDSKPPAPEKPEQGLDIEPATASHPSGFSFANPVEHRSEQGDIREDPGPKKPDEAGIDDEQSVEQMAATRVAAELAVTSQPIVPRSTDPSPQSIEGLPERDDDDDDSVPFSLTFSAPIKKPTNVSSTVVARTHNTSRINVDRVEASTIALAVPTVDPRKPESNTSLEQQPTEESLPDTTLRKTNDAPSGAPASGLEPTKNAVPEDISVNALAKEREEVEATLPTLLPAAEPPTDTAKIAQSRTKEPEKVDGETLSVEEEKVGGETLSVEEAKAQDEPGKTNVPEEPSPSSSRIEHHAIPRSGKLATPAEELQEANAPRSAIREQLEAEQLEAEKLERGSGVVSPSEAVVHPSGAELEGVTPPKALNPEVTTAPDVPSTTNKTPESDSHGEEVIHALGPKKRNRSVSSDVIILDATSELKEEENVKQPIPKRRKIPSAEPELPRSPPEDKSGGDGRDHELSHQTDEVERSELKAEVVHKQATGQKDHRIVEQAESSVRVVEDKIADKPVEKPSPRDVSTWNTDGKPKTIRPIVENPAPVNKARNAGRNSGATRKAVEVDKEAGRQMYASLEDRDIPAGIDRDPCPMALSEPSDSYEESSDGEISDDLPEADVEA